MALLAIMRRCRFMRVLPVARNGVGNPARSWDGQRATLPQRLKGARPARSNCWVCGRDRSVQPTEMERSNRQRVQLSGVRDQEPGTRNQNAASDSWFLIPDA